MLLRNKKDHTYWVEVDKFEDYTMATVVKGKPFNVDATTSFNLHKDMWEVLPFKEYYDKVQTL